MIYRTSNKRRPKRLRHISNFSLANKNNKISCSAPYLSSRCPFVYKGDGNTTKLVRLSFAWSAGYACLHACLSLPTTVSSNLIHEHFVYSLWFYCVNKMKWMNEQRMDYKKVYKFICKCVFMSVSFKFQRHLWNVVGATKRMRTRTARKRLISSLVSMAITNYVALLQTYSWQHNSRKPQVYKPPA